MMNPHDIPEMKETGDVRAERIARVYAESLYAAAEKAGELDVVLEEYESVVRDVVHVDPRLATLFTTGALGRYARAEALAKAFKDRASPTFYAFLQVLNSHERLELFRSIARALRALTEERARRVRVFVVSAVPLSDDETTRIENGIREVMKLEPIVVPSVDPSLLGGVKIRVGDKQYDASIRTRLENLKNQILASSSHEIQSRRDRFSSAN
jgi:F-type H+-transporting ATPase subunit delta